MIQRQKRHRRRIRRFNGKLKADDILNWFVRMAVCGWILNLNIVGLGDTVQNKRSLQRVVSNQRWHRKRIQWKIKDGLCSAGSVWLDTQSQYCGIDDTPTTTNASN